MIFWGKKSIKPNGFGKHLPVPEAMASPWQCPVTNHPPLAGTMQSCQHSSSIQLVRDLWSVLNMSPSKSSWEKMAFKAMILFCCKKKLLRPMHSFSITHIEAPLWEDLSYSHGNCGLSWQRSAPRHTWEGCVQVCGALVGCTEVSPGMVTAPRAVCPR